MLHEEGKWGYTRKCITLACLSCHEKFNMPITLGICQYFAVSMDFGI